MKKLKIILLLVFIFISVSIISYSSDIQMLSPWLKSGTNVFLGVSTDFTGIGTSTPLCNLHVTYDAPTNPAGIGSTESFGLDYKKDNSNVLVRGAMIVVERTGAAPISAPTSGLNSFVYLMNTGGDTSTLGNIGGRYGIRTEIGISGTIVNARGLSSFGIDNTSIGGTATFTNSHDYYAEGSRIDTGSIENAYNFRGQNHLDIGTGSITNAIGIWLVSQTAGTSNNWGLVLAGNGLGSGILMGPNQENSISRDATTGETVFTGTSGIVPPSFAFASAPATCISGAIIKESDSDTCAGAGGNGALCVCNNTGNGWVLLVNY